MKDWRYKSCYFLFLFVFLLILSRLYFWQILKNKELQIKAVNQRKFTKTLLTKRGEIFSNNNSPLVVNKTSYLVFANLKEIKENSRDIAKKLANILVTKDQLLNEDLASISASKRESRSYQERIKELVASLTESLNNKDLVWVILATKVPLEKKQQIEVLGIKGIGFEEVADRLFPEASTAAHLLGFMAKDKNGNDIGYFGLEGYYNQELTGQAGRIFGEKDVFGVPILISQLFKKPARYGDNLILSLDLSIQKIIERELKNGILKYQSRGGTVIVLNPENGAIIAAVSLPVYDPNVFNEYKEEAYKNPAIADSYEPGSIFKPLIMSLAINENKVKPTTRCDQCNGPRLVGGYLIKTFNDQYHPNLTMTEVLENSDNTGMIFVGEKLTSQQIYEYLAKYGFGRLTGVDLQEEATGSLRSPDQWYPIDKATITFGQGVSVTSLQMVQAWAALANGGKIYQPQVAAKIKASDDQSVKLKPKLKNQVIKPETAKILTEMLVSTCEKSPLHFFKEMIPELKNYRIAAKSGTAQIPIAGKYAEGITIGLAIGFAPADNPKFLVLVKLTEPQVNPWGANTAGPIFFNIMKELLIYYGIAP